jgi:hypothetical protein
MVVAFIYNNNRKFLSKQNALVAQAMLKHEELTSLRTNSISQKFTHSNASIYFFNAKVD